MITETTHYLGPGEVVTPSGKAGFVEVRLLDGETLWARLALALPYTPAIGDEVLIGAHSVLAPGAWVGHRSILEHAVSIGAHVVIGNDVHIGGGSTLYTGVRVGDRAVIGKACVIPAGTVIPAGAVIPDGSVLPAARAGRRGRSSA